MQLWRDGTHTTLELTELFEVARSTGYRTIQRAGLLTGLIARGRRLGHIALPEPGQVPLTVRPESGANRGRLRGNGEPGWRAFDGVGEAGVPRGRG